MYNDDEPIVVPQDLSGGRPEFDTGKTKAVIFNKTEAPLEETKFKAMLEITGTSSGAHRKGLDLVTVLDVSGSMGGEKLEKMKTAMQFMIKKLSPVDRLSVVSFAHGSARICPLRQITEASQTEIEALVNGLHAGGNTNITAGLQTGLKVLNERSLTDGRVTAIMLMSDGEQNAGGDATQIPIGKIAVHAFGFGKDCDPKVLKAIADNGEGGTFSDVQNLDHLSIAFSQCLAGLLTVAVQDLTLTFTKQVSEIEKVYAGNYQQTEDKAAGTVTVFLGDLYDKETRKITVDLILLKVETRMASDALQVDYSFKGTKKPLFEANPIFISVIRVKASVEKEKEEVMLEANRLKTADMMKQARLMADEEKLDDAKEKIVEAENMLEDAVEEPHQFIEMLKSELQQMLKLMKTQKIYDKQGRPFMLSSETSHDRQRFASKGDVEKLRLFATPRMNTYLEQAKAFDKDPSQPLPSAEEDVKQELAADPLAPIAGALSYYIQTAIEALKSIDNIINGRNP